LDEFIEEISLENTNRKTTLDLVKDK